MIDIKLWVNMCVCKDVRVWGDVYVCVCVYVGVGVDVYVYGRAKGQWV